MNVLPILLFAGLIVAVTSGLKAERLSFNRDIRRILSDRCFACHAADAATKGIRLRLDREGTAKADVGGGRRAVVPANRPQALYSNESAVKTRRGNERRAYAALVLPS
jgi:hypothetical protein